MSSNSKKEKGFTIIEVVLVLAIAGLIFLVVFLALPALQKSQRDQQRRSDVGRLVSAVQTYKSNNNGSNPTFNAAFITTYLAADSAFKDPSTGNDYALSAITTSPITGTNPNAVAGTTFGTIFVASGAKCNTAGVGSNFLAGGAGQRAFVVALESGGSYCQGI